jgi:Mlc titration factor MtfA (ptsG expression regulator)
MIGPPPLPIASPARAPANNPPMLWFKGRRRSKLIQQPLPEAWWLIVDRRVPLARKLDPEERRRLGGIIRVLLEEKRFEGCAGLQITDEIRLTIACQAALLVLNRPGDYYPNLRSILVYPAEYRVTTEEFGPAGIVTESDEVRLGETWPEGSLVLSWEDVLRGAADEDDGRNVVFHEFAHQLDGQSGDMDGAPALPGPARYRDWARVLGKEYEDLARSLERGQQPLLDPYGSTHPAEFFAVATELFFERPEATRRTYPDLYQQLMSFYGQDPAGRSRLAPSSRPI